MRGREDGRKFRLEVEDGGHWHRVEGEHTAQEVRGLVGDYRRWLKLTAEQVRIVPLAERTEGFNRPFAGGLAPRTELT